MSAPRASPPPVASTPAVVASPRATAPPAIPKPPKAKRKAAKPVERAQPVARIPHDRGPVPLAAFVPAGEFDRGLLAAAGVVLLLTALGGAVVVGTARRQLVAAAVVFFAFSAPAAQAAPIAYELVGTVGGNGWHTSNVTIRWTVDPVELVSAPTCPAAELISGEGTTTRQCTATFTWGTVTSPVVTIRIDKTAPTGVAGSLTRAPDSDGWYNHPVAAAFSGQDAVSGIAGCSAPTYSGGDSAAAGLTGTCADAAGNVSAVASVGFKYDSTPPTVSPTPDRQPDSRGWYRKPVTVTFAGADSTSGVASCSAPARYAGPDVAKAAVAGSCRDRAGNSAEASHALAYDSTAPRVTSVKAEVDKGVARLGWDRADDVVRVEIVRSPGVNGAKATTVYQGAGASFVDRTIRAGIRYRYALTAMDVAGNAATKTVTALEQAVLYGPVPGSTLRAPPVLRWQAVSGARFYNVQLYRGGKKILSAWPTTASLRLTATWSFAGKRQRLVPGLYRWYVWPARGTRERPKYGRALGSSTFRVAR